MDLDVAQFNLTSASTADMSCESPSKVEYQRSMKTSLFGDNQSARILAYTQKAPQPKDGYQADMKVLFTQNKISASKTVKSTRHIPQAPDRILDAPGFKQDFYLNLIDWSANNIIAVALDTVRYLFLLLIKLLHN